MTNLVIIFLCIWSKLKDYFICYILVICYFIYKSHFWEKSDFWDIGGNALNPCWIKYISKLKLQTLKFAQAWSKMGNLSSCVSWSNSWHKLIFCVFLQKLKVAPIIFGWERSKNGPPRSLDSKVGCVPRKN